MASIYLVWDLKRQVYLAMKVLHPDLADDPTFTRRFQREASALEKLVHPHIVPFYGMFEDGELTFLLERYIDGASLNEALRKRGGQPLPIRDVLVIFKALYTSLGYAHEHRIIHCDVKPGNMLIDQGGEVYLTDFGIARYMDGSITTTSTSGTPLYMAPEQALGRPPTPQTDEYALGVVLFELFTGLRPFRGDEDLPPQAGTSSVERIRYQHLYAPIPDPRQYRRELPEGIAFVVMKAMAKDPADRFGSVQEMADALARAAGARFVDLPDRVNLALIRPLQEAQTQIETVDTRPPVGAGAPWPPAGHARPAKSDSSQRRLLLAGGIGLLGVVCLLAVIGLALVFARILPGVAWQGGAATNTVTPAGMSSTATAASGTAQPAAETAQPAQAASATPVEILPSETPVMADTPTGEIVIVARNAAGRNTLYMLNLETGERGELPRAANLQDAISDMPQWSPDGSMLAWRSQYGGRGHIVLMDMNERTPYLLSAGESLENPQSPAFLPDGKGLTFWASGAMVTADARSGGKMDQTSLTTSANLFVWNPVRGLLAYALRQSDDYQVIISGGANLVNYQIETGGTEYAPAWSVDGELLAFQSDAGRGAGLNEIWSVRWNGQDLLRITNSPAAAWSRAPTWSPDSTWIAYVSNQAGGIGADYGELFAVQLLSGKTVQLTNTGGQVYDWRPAWRPAAGR